MNLKTSLKMDDQLDPIIHEPLKTEKEKEAEKRKIKYFIMGMI